MYDDLTPRQAVTLASNRAARKTLDVVDRADGVYARRVKTAAERLDALYEARRAAQANDPSWLGF